MPRNVARAWCFTEQWDNNGSDLELKDQGSFPPRDFGWIDFSCWPKVVFAVWQLELSDSGQLHHQGYVEFNAMVTLNQCREFLPAHWEATVDREASFKYCQKEQSRVDGPWTYGVRSHQGIRTDLADIKQRLDAGERVIDITDNHFGSWVRYHRAFSTYKSEKQEPVNEAKEVLVLYGATGLGKSRAVHDLFPDVYVIPPPQPGGALWLDGYNGQENVLFDDFYGMSRGDSWRKSDMLRLLDRYGLSMPVKGSFTYWKPKRIFITSEIHPSLWWPSDDNSSLLRRITHIYRYVSLGVRVTEKSEGVLTGRTEPDSSPRLVSSDVIDLTQ